MLVNTRGVNLSLESINLSQMHTRNGESSIIPITHGIIRQSLIYMHIALILFTVHKIPQSHIIFVDYLKVPSQATL